MNDVKLLPCPNPWCESKAGYVEERDIWFIVVCEYCGNRGPGRKSREDAIAAWNHRPADPRTLLPNKTHFAGRLYGLQEAACIAGETSIGLAIYDRIKFIEANADTLADADPRLAAAGELEKALRELYALVRGECSSLLDEDSGGCAALAVEIDAALAKYAEASR
jgi:hypothetical protein